MNSACSITHFRARAFRPALAHPNHEVVMLLARPVVVLSRRCCSFRRVRAGRDRGRPTLANTPVCTASGDQWGLVSVTDGAGGIDRRPVRLACSGNAGTYAQRFNAVGVPQ